MSNRNRIWNGETITIGHRKYFVEINSNKSFNVYQECHIAHYILQEKVWQDKERKRNEKDAKESADKKQKQKVEAQRKRDKVVSENIFRVLGL